MTTRPITAPIAPVAASIPAATVLVFLGSSLGFATNEVVISEPQFEAPSVVSPTPGDVATVVTDSDGNTWWILEVTNSDYQPDFNIDDGYVGFETLPSVGVFDTLDDRLEWTNQTFRCFLDDSCESVPQTADQVAFGDDFVRLPQLFDEATGTVAYHAEHAFLVGQDPYEWLVSQETLSLAIPLEPSPLGTFDIWVGYTYIYTDDLVGVPVRFTRDAMAVTEVSVTVPTSNDASTPTWVVSALVGLVGIIVFFGLIALTVSRGVLLARRNK